MFCFMPAVNEGEFQSKVDRDRDGFLGAALIRTDDDAVLPGGDVMLDPFAKQWVHLSRTRITARVLRIA